MQQSSTPLSHFMLLLLLRIRKLKKKKKKKKILHKALIANNLPQKRNRLPISILSTVPFEVVYFDCSLPFSFASLILSLTLQRICRCCSRLERAFSFLVVTVILIVIVTRFLLLCHIHYSLHCFMSMILRFALRRRWLSCLCYANYTAYSCTRRRPRCTNVPLRLFLPSVVRCCWRCMIPCTSHCFVLLLLILLHHLMAMIN